MWLLEVNLTPDMSHSTEVTAELVEQMVEDTAKVILDCHDTGLRLPEADDEAEEDSNEEDDEEEEDDTESDESDDGQSKEDGYCSYDEDFEYNSPADSGEWVCIHRGKATGWNFADFLAREGQYADRKKSRRQYDAADDGRPKPLR